MKIDSMLRKKIKQRVIQEIKKEAEKKAFLITPYTLDNQEYAKILHAFPFLARYEVQQVQDKSIIAGFVLKWGSKILDASFAGRLDAYAKH